MSLRKLVLRIMLVSLGLAAAAGASAVFVAGHELVWRIVLTAVAMWATAHLLLFKLHLPSRYTHWSLRIVLAMGAGIVLATTWEALRRRRQTLAEQGNSRRSAIFRLAASTSRPSRHSL